MFRIRRSDKIKIFILLVLFSFLSFIFKINPLLDTISKYGISTIILSIILFNILVPLAVSMIGLTVYQIANKEI